MIIQPTWQKPPRGAVLRRSHSLIKGMTNAFIFNELVGEKVFDSVQRKPHTQTSGSTFPPWTSDGLRFLDTTTNRIAIHEDDGYPMGDVDRTFIIRVLFDDFPAGDDHNIAVETDNDGANSVPYVLYVDCDDALARHHLETGAITLSDNTWHTIATQFRTSDNYTRGFVDGMLDLDWTLCSTYSPSVLNDRLNIGHRRPDAEVEHSRGLRGVIAYIYIWDRILTTDEIVSVHREPYAMFEPQLRIEQLYGGGIWDYYDDNYWVAFRVYQEAV